MRSTLLFMGSSPILLAVCMGVASAQSEQTEKKSASPQTQESKERQKSPQTSTPSLGELARRLKNEHASAAHKPAKTYTNDDLPEPDRPSGQTATAQSDKATLKENPKDGLKYVWIPPGTFQMGCSAGDNECDDDEKPSHEIRISKGFWMAQTEVTVGAYKRFVSGTGRSMPPKPNILGRILNDAWNNDAKPIVNVTGDEARDYCSWVGGRVPTEAEWEYAARGGSREARYGLLDEIAWYADNSGRQRLGSERIRKEEPDNYVKRLNENRNEMHEVGQKRPNGFGLYDMLGNVWELVNDWYDQHYYQNSAAEDPAGPSSGRGRVLRGGSCVFGPWKVRASSRLALDPGSRNGIVGFRCVEDRVGAQETKINAPSGETGNPVPGRQPELSPATTPPGVEYQRATRETLQQAADLIKTVLSSDYQGTQHIFPGGVICGPFIWPYLSQNDFARNPGGLVALTKDRQAIILDKAVSPSELAEIERTARDNGGVILKMIKGDENILSLESYLRKVLREDGGFVVRALNPGDFVLYQSISPGPIIKEPVFIVESKSHNFLMQFDNGRVLIIDDFKDRRR